MNFNFDEEKYLNYALKTDQVLEMANFIIAHRFQRIMPVMKETLQKVLNEGKPTLILFEKTKGRVLESFKIMMQDYPSMNAMYKNLEDAQNQEATNELMSILGVFPREAPVLVLLPFKEPFKGIIPKYKTNKLSKRNIKKFVDSGMEGKLEIYLKSEDEITDPERNYDHVTLNNFDDKISKPKSFYLIGLDFVQEHIPKTVKKAFHVIGQKVKGLNLTEDLGVGVCDVSKNEISGKVEITMIPQIMIIDTNTPSKRHTYKGELESEKIEEWVKEITGISLEGYEQDINEIVDKFQAKIGSKSQSEIDL
jgi:hypothetical protein